MVMVDISLNMSNEPRCEKIFFFFCICENKDADQLRSNCAADHRFCFRYIDTTIPLLSKSEISSLLPSSVAVQPGLYRTLSKTSKTGFLTTRLKYSMGINQRTTVSGQLCTLELQLDVPMIDSSSRYSVNILDLRIETRHQDLRLKQPLFQTSYYDKKYGRRGSLNPELIHAVQEY